MDYQEAIETLQDIHDVAESRIKNGDSRGVIYIPKDKLDDLKTSISAMQELDRCKKKLREVYGECSGMIEAMVDSLVRYQKMLGMKTPLKARLLTDEDVDLWDGYKNLGTLEEVRDAVEKQIPKKPKGDYNSVPHYRCPTCNGAVKLYGDSDEDKICRWCGQHIDWSEEE